MGSQKHTEGSYNLNPTMIPPHQSQNPTYSSAPPSIQQAPLIPDMYPPPPPSMQASAQSYTHLSYIHQTSLPPSTVLPPPPPLPPATASQYIHSSFSHSVPQPPPPPPSSSSPVPDIAAERDEGKGCSKIDLAGEDDRTAKGSCVHHESEPASLYANSDTEMEDDITQPEMNKEQWTSHHSAETYSTMDPSLNLQTGLPSCNASNTHAQLCQESGDDGSRQSSSSPYSWRSKNVPDSGGGDMYDPFLDSIEPSPHLSKTLTPVQEHEPIIHIKEINPMPSLSHSTNKPLSVEDNNAEEHEKLGANANGEAQGVSLETDSPYSLDEVAGKDENTKKNSREKTLEKDSRSMKLFKVALTQFVKDLLKPSWRQGNMSKEAFKTIVKKTVDKVSSSMEGRRVPKSRAKIDRYIDSSQQKLRKLVMGYVDKYVKA